MAKKRRVRQYARDEPYVSKKRKKFDYDPSIQDLRNYVRQPGSKEEIHKIHPYLKYLDFEPADMIKRDDQYTSVRSSFVFENQPDGKKKPIAYYNYYTGIPYPPVSPYFPETGGTPSHLNYLFVHPDYRKGQGWGSYLVKKLKTSGDKYKAPGVELVALDDEAKRFYKTKHGFETHLEPGQLDDSYANKMIWKRPRENEDVDVEDGDPVELNNNAYDTLYKNRPWSFLGYDLPIYNFLSKQNSRRQRRC